MINEKRERMTARNLIAELQHEAISTRKMLERLPIEQFNWKPHEKSMSLATLAGHIADIPAYAALVLKAGELDFAGDAYTVSNAKDAAELVSVFEKNLDEAITSFQDMGDETVLQDMFTLRSGEHVIATMPKGIILRTLLFSHMIHHRGQLSVYLRLLNIPVPGIYGPSADEA